MLKLPLSDPAGGERSTLKNRHRGVTHTCRGHLLSDPTGGRDPRWRTDIEGSHTHAEVIYCLTRQEGEIHDEEQTSRGHTHVQRSSTVWPGRRWEIHAEEQTSRGHTHVQRSSTVWPDRRERSTLKNRHRGVTHTSRGHLLSDPAGGERSTLKNRHRGVTHTSRGHLLSDPTGGERSTLKNRHRGVTHTSRGHLLSDPTGGRDPHWRTDIEGSHTRPEVIYCLTRQEGEIHAEEQTSRGHTHVQRSSTVWPDRRERSTLKNRHRGVTHTSRGHLLSDPTGGRDPRWRTDIEGSHTRPEVIYCLTRQEGEIHAEEQTSRGHTHHQRSSTVWPGRRERSTLKNRHRGVTHTSRGHLLSDPTGGRDPRWRTDIEGSHTHAEVIYCLTRQEGEIHAEEQTSRGHTHMQRSSTVWPDRRERSTLKNRHRGVTHTCRGHLLSDPTGGRDPRWRTDIEGSHTHAEVIYCLTRQEVRDPRWRTDIEGSHTHAEVIYCLTRQEVRDPRWRKDIEGSHTRPEVIYCLTRQEVRDPRWRTDIEGSHTHARDDPEVIYCCNVSGGNLHYCYCSC